MEITKIFLQDFGTPGLVQPKNQNTTSKITVDSAVQDERNDKKNQANPYNAQNDGAKKLKEAYVENKSIFNDEATRNITLSLEEFERIKQEIFQHGKNCGIDDTKQQIELQKKTEPVKEKRDLNLEILSVVNAINDKLQNTDELFNKFFSKWSNECVSLAYAIGKKIVDKIYALVPEDLIIDFVRKNLLLLKNELNVVIRINPEHKDKILAMLKADYAEFEVNVVGDSEMLEGDCKVLWDGGSFAKDKQLLYIEIDKILENYLYDKQTV